MELVFAVVIGLVIGFVLGHFIFCPSLMGELRIDRSDPDGPFLFLGLSKGVDEVAKKKMVTFTVNDHNYISQD